MRFVANDDSARGLPDRGSGPRASLDINRAEFPRKALILTLRASGGRHGLNPRSTLNAPRRLCCFQMVGTHRVRQSARSTILILKGMIKTFQDPYRWPREFANSSNRNAWKFDVFLRDQRATVSTPPVLHVVRRVLGRIGPGDM